MPTVETVPQGFAEFRRAVEKHSKEWIIAAMIDGSIGYHSYESARIMVENALKGRFWGCERTSACFNSDPIAEILHDVRYLEAKQRYDPEAVLRLARYVVALKELDPIAQQTAGLMYPTCHP